jgi:hypothetical protein
LIRHFLVWLQTEFMKGSGNYPETWSEKLLGSLNFWGLMEGTHLLFLMLFAGTIFIVDARLLGVTFKRTPVSVVSDRILPLTVFGFAAMILTGLVVFYAKPLVYYHNVWFRLKMVFLVLALLNILVFHGRVQKNQAAWDALPVPPGSARLSAILSITSWILIITMGRFIAYDWFDCGKPAPHFMNVVQECAASEKGAVDTGSTVNSNAGPAQ